MSPGRRASLIGLCALWGCSAQAQPARPGSPPNVSAPAPAATTPAPTTPPPAGPLATVLDEVTATQMQVDRPYQGGRATFRATLVGREDQRLVLVTAAHCVAGAKVGDVFRLGPKEATWEMKVVAVSPNPRYRDKGMEAPGADCALLRLEVVPGQDNWVETVKSLRLAQVSRSPVARPGGETVSVLVLDQFGKAHVAKAGNYRNPRWLEWGRGFTPKRGDSGSGVFIVKRSAEGKLRPELVATVTDADPEGGGGALVWTADRWLSEALSPPPSPPRS